MRRLSISFKNGFGSKIDFEDFCLFINVMLPMEMKMIRVLIEKFARKRVFKRRLPSKFKSTALYLSPDSQLKYLKFGEKAFDQELLDIAYGYVNEVSNVWDIGANVGVFAFAAASLATKGAVLAVEADIWLVELMKKSRLLRENSKLCIEILPLAISDQCGVAKFLISSRGRAMNALKLNLRESVADDAREEALVPTLTLDSLLDFSCKPTFIKVDVEGAEAMVLRGAKKILTEVRPIFYIEVGAEAKEEATAVFNKNNYILFNGADGGELSSPISSCVFNTLAIPCEQLER